MEAHRVLLETDDQGRLTGTPALPPLARVEAIFLVLENLPPATAKRKPAAGVANLQILGDVMGPAIDEDDWTIGS
ncbi:MAG: hypothetical protein SF187_11320 [Deltaproteobacteria bacterium]|nr:hypothetical protein [Deltaproteobacteria bacterium]